jgi:hypothetical protein
LALLLLLLLLLVLCLLQDYDITEANISSLHIGGNLVLSCFTDLPCDVSLDVSVDGNKQQGGRGAELL